MKSLNTNAATVALDVQIQIVPMNISLQIQKNLASNGGQTFQKQFKQAKF